MDTDPGTDANPLCDPTGPTTCWTTNNVSEALPGVVTPLTWSLFGPGSEIGTRRAMYRMGIFPRSEVRRDAPVDERFFGVFFGRAALNVDTYRRVADSAPGMSAESSERQLLGSVREDVDSHPTWKRLPSIATRLPVAFLAETRRIRAVVADQRAWWQRHVHGRVEMSADDARALLAESARRLTVANEHHTFASMIALAMVGQIEALCARADLDGLAASLTTGYGGYEEQEFLEDLWSVADGELDRDVFVGRYGFYGPAELAADSWREAPAIVDSVAERFRASDVAGPEELLARQTAQRELAERELRAALPLHLRGPPALVLALARRGIPLREVGKAGWLMGMDGARAASSCLGGHLNANGSLDDSRDVLLLTLAEAVSPTVPSVPTLRDRRRLMAEYEEFDLPQSWVGVPEPVPHDEAPSGRSRLEGIPVTPGVVIARAQVATSLEEAHDIEVGNVLVCRTTDPSWVPAFTLAGGLAIDIGSTASHGAIVARELGIPCVINTRVGTTALHTGDTVRLDGSAGTVEVVGAAS